MNGNCHFVFGAACGIAVGMNIDKINLFLPNITAVPETATLFVLGGLLGGIFPDIDNVKSFMGRLAYPVSKVINRVSKWFGKGGKHHRGIFHDPILYVTGIILSYLYFPSLVGFFLGCLSHIYLDIFNPVGVPFFLGKNVHIANILSGSKTAITFTWINVIAVSALGVIFKLGAGNFIGKVMF